MMRRFGAAGGGGGGSADPYWANVVSLLHFDGADGSTTFTDQTGKTWTPSGNAQIDTAQSKFGGASGVFDGSGDYIKTPHSTDLQLTSSEWTVECFIRWSGATGPQAILSKRIDNGGGSAGWTLFIRNGTICAWNGSVEVSSPSGAISANTWTHVVWQRRSGNIEMYTDGVLRYSTGYSIYANAYAVTIACAWFYFNPVDFFGGHIDEMRVTSDVARYTANFTPPSAPFPDS